MKTLKGKKKRKKKIEHQNVFLQEKLRNPHKQHMSKNKKKPESQKRKKNENFYYNITCFNVPRTTQYKYVYISFIQKMNRKRKKKKE